MVSNRLLTPFPAPSLLPQRTVQDVAVPDKERGALPHRALLEAEGAPTRVLREGKEGGGEVADPSYLPPPGNLSSDNLGCTQTPDDFGGSNFGQTGPMTTPPPHLDNFPKGHLEGGKQDSLRRTGIRTGTVGQGVLLLLELFF